MGKARADTAVVIIKQDGTILWQFHRSRIYYEIIVAYSFSALLLCIEVAGLTWTGCFDDKPMSKARGNRLVLDRFLDSDYLLGICSCPFIYDWSTFGTVTVPSSL